MTTEPIELEQINDDINEEMFIRVIQKEWEVMHSMLKEYLKRDLLPGDPEKLSTIPIPSEDGFYLKYNEINIGTIKRIVEEEVNSMTVKWEYHLIKQK